MSRTILKKSIIVVLLTGAALGATYLFADKKSAGRPVDVDAKVSISAEIGEDLTVYFTETFSIDSNKTRNGNGRRWVFMPPGNTYEFEGVEDITGGNPVPITNATNTTTGEKNEIHWMFPPQTGRRTFLVKYAVRGAARPAIDGDYVFSWTFFDKRNPLAIDELSVLVTAPDGGVIGSPAFFRLGGEFRNVNASGSQFSVGPKRLSSFQVAEASLPFAASLTPARGIPSVNGTANQFLENVKKEWESRAAGERNFAILMVILPIVLGVGIIAAAWLLFHRFGREYKVENPPIYERDLPTAETPAEVGWLTRFGTIDITDLTGTIMDLARRRHLRIQESADPGSKNVILVATPERAKPDEHLQAHEIRTLAWLFPPGVTWLDFNARKEELKKNQTLWTEFWEGFQSDVDSLASTKGLMERKSSSCLVALTGLIGICILILSVIAGINLSRWWVVTAFAGAVMTVASSGMSRRSRLGAMVNERWQAFRRYIHDFSTIPDHPPASVILWEHYLAYAIPLGEGDTVVEYMKLRPPVEGERDWYPANTAALLWMTGGVSDWKSAGTPSSSGSGGGGFGGGGGGGFGGGGGASFD